MSDDDLSRDSPPTVDERGSQRTPAPSSRSAPRVASARYASGDEIARGGMGRVVEATDTLLERTVAVKEALTRDAESLRRFARETKITARLEHPSIVPVYDAGRGRDGLPFYVMRKVSGRPLEQLLREASTLAQRLALIPNVLAACSAVAHAHRRGIVHRDLKPSNILVGDLGETVVIDWGLAKVLADPDDDVLDVAAAPSGAGESLLTRVGTVFGTPGFMSPEQARGDAVDARGDVYALGATLHYVLAGHAPHTGGSADEVMVATAHDPAPGLARVAPDVPAELSTIVDKALAFDAATRYADAAGLATDLQQYLAGRLVPSHRYSTWQRVRRFVRANRVAVAVGAASLIALVVVGALAVSRVLAERDRADDEAALATQRQHDAETATARANDRADALLLAQATALLDKDPTAAVAVVTPLAASPLHWREVRDLAAAAHARGVAWGLPASRRTADLAMAHDLVHAASCGSDGVVREYDLASHATRVLGVVPSLPGRCGLAFSSDDTRVAVMAAGVVFWFTRASGAVRMVIAPSRAHSYDAHALWPGDREIVWIDIDGTVWRLGDDAAAPVRVAFPVPITALCVAPTPHRIVGAASAGVWLIDGDAPARALIDGDVRELACADDASTIAASVAGVTHVFREPRFTPAASWPAPELLGLAVNAGHVFDLTVESVLRDGRPRHTAIHGYYPQALGSTSIAVADHGDVFVLSETVDRVLHAPVHELGALGTVHAGTYVLAAAEGVIMVWDIADTAPLEWSLDHVASFTFLENAELFVQFQAFSAVIDIAAGKVRPLVAPPLIALVMAKGPRWIFAVDQHGQSAWLDRERGPAVPALANVDSAAVIGDRVLAATHDGQLFSLAPGAGSATSLSPGFGPVSYAMGDSDGYALVVFESGKVWRHRQDGRVDVRQVPSTGPNAVDGDGDVFYAAGRVLHRWAGPGDDEIWATLPGDVQAVHFVSGVLLVTTQSMATYAVDLAPPHRVTSTADSGRAGYAIPVNGLAAQAGDDGVEVTDYLTGSRWLVPMRGETVASPKLSADGRWLIAINDDGLVGWRLDLPPDAAATASWLRGMTNATAEHGAVVLGWR